MVCVIKKCAQIFKGRKQGKAFPLNGQDLTNPSFMELHARTNALDFTEFGGVAWSGRPQGRIPRIR